MFPPLNVTRSLNLELTLLRKSSKPPSRMHAHNKGHDFWRIDNLYLPEEGIRIETETSCTAVITMSGICDPIFRVFLQSDATSTSCWWYQYWTPPERGLVFSFLTLSAFCNVFLLLGMTSFRKSAQWMLLFMTSYSVLLWLFCANGSKLYYCKVNSAVS